MSKSKTLAVLTIAALASFAAADANAAVGLGLRGGSLGYGIDFDIGLTQRINLRVGYNGFNYDYTVNNTDVRYDGTLKISSASGFLDWHAFGGGFRFTLGAVGSGPKIDVVGTPTGGTYQIGNGVYSAAEVGSLNGEIKIGNSVAPYIGLGFGNVVSPKHRVTFLFDFGAIYGGTPSVNLTAVCGAAINGTPACTQLQNDTQVEIQKLKNDVSAVKWYPVVSLGLGIRF